jgi:hypothetical protein
MKKLLALLLFMPMLAWAQCNPFLSNQVLTASALNAAIAAPCITGGTINATTQGRLDNSTLVATDAFVNQQASGASATVPFAGVTGGVWNQASLGTGATVVIFVSSSPGPVGSILSVVNGGSGYAVGDLLVINAGNVDAVLRVTSVGAGGSVQTSGLSVAYGGSGYMTGLQATAVPAPAGRRAVVMSGTLTSNVTFIIQNGTYLTASREVEFANNTTGAFTVTVYLSNGAGGHVGNGVVMPRGTNNSTAIRLYTDGVNDIWPETNAFPSGVTCSGAPSGSFAVTNGVVTHC